MRPMSMAGSARRAPPTCSENSSPPADSAGAATLSRGGEFHQRIDGMHFRFQMLERFWTRSAGRPIEQLDRVDDRDGAAALQLRDAADIAGGDEVGLDAGDMRKFPVSQARREFRLEQVIGSCG